MPPLLDRQHYDSSSDDDSDNEDHTSPPVARKKTTPRSVTFSDDVEVHKHYSSPQVLDGETFFDASSPEILDGDKMPEKEGLRPRRLWYGPR